MAYFALPTSGRSDSILDYRVHEEATRVKTSPLKKAIRRSRVWAGALALFIAAWSFGFACRYAAAFIWISASLSPPFSVTTMSPSR